MNNNISVSNNQAFFKDPLNIAYWLGGSMPATFVPEHLSNKIFTEARLKMTNEILRYMNMHNIAFPSHATLAKVAGVQRQAALKYFKWAEEIGLFKVVHRGKSWESNIYFLGPVLKDYRVRWALRHIFSGLHRAFMKTVRLLNEAINSVKRTLLININVFKTNTSLSSYKEKRLYSTPFLKKDAWMNKQKAMWADWSLTERDYEEQFVTEQEYKQFYKKSDTPADEIKKKVETQSQQQMWNQRRYPNDPTSYYKKVSVQEPKKYVNATDAVTRIMHIDDKKERLRQLQVLLFECEPISQRYVQIQIDKTKAKINEL